MFYLFFYLFFQLLTPPSRDAYRFIHDQTLRLANHGYTMNEIAEMLALPRVLSHCFHNRFTLLLILCIITILLFINPSFFHSQKLIPLPTEEHSGL